LNSTDLEHAIQGHDVVLSAFGPRVPISKQDADLLQRFAVALTSAMGRSGVRRAVVESVAFLFRDSILPPTYLFGRLFFPTVVADASGMERVFEESGLDWTMVRPPQLTDKPYTGRYRVGVGRLPVFGFKISRGRGRFHDQSGRGPIQSTKVSESVTDQKGDHMTPYSIVLYLRVLAAIGLFATLSFESLSLFHLRRASTLAEARLWIDPVPRLPLVTAASGLIVLCAGVYLTVRMEAFNLAWPKVTLAALLLIAPLGALTGRRMRGIRQVCASAMAMSPELLNRLQYPGLKISLGIRCAVFSGIVLLMAAKPDLWQSVGIVSCSVVFGLLLSLVSWRRTGSLSARRAEAEGRSRTA
jgi:hypothetical protein